MNLLIKAQARLSSIEGKVAIKTSLAAGLSLLLGTYFTHLLHRNDIFISALWTVQSAIVVQQTHLGSTYRSAWMRFLGAVIGCFFGGLMTTLIGSTPLSLAIAIFATVVLCSLAGIKDSVRIACLSVAVVMVLWGLHPDTSPWAFSFYRFLDSCLGILIAVVVAQTLWPALVDHKIGQSLGNTLQNLSALFRLVTTPQSLTDAQFKQFRLLSNETRDLFWKNQQILEDSRLELLTKHSNLDEWKSLLIHIERIYERIFALSKIYREHLPNMLDPGIQQKYEKIIKECDSLLLQLALVLQGAGTLPSLTELTDAVKELDDELLRYRASKTTRAYNFNDVEGFFVFFYTLKAIADEIRRVYQDVQKILSQE